VRVPPESSRRQVRRYAVKEVPYQSDANESQRDACHGLERPPSAQRFVLCRPRGGLNDTLCQIEKCWKYAETHGRRLVIDTRRSCLFGEFIDYFVPNDCSDVSVTLEDEDLARLNQLECVPGSLRGRLGSYTTAFTSEGRYIDIESSAPLTFDFNRSFSESVLVHEQCGGGQQSFDLLRRVTLSPSSRHFVVSACRRLPSEYAALHVRNTDYRTDYEDFLRFVASSLNGGSILICSDDPQVLIDARSMFDRTEVLTVRSPPLVSAGKPLHRYSSHENDDQRRAAAYDSIADLVALGRATDFHFSDVTRGYPSGFSRLAEFLCNNEDVVAALMGEPHPERLASDVRRRTHHWRPSAMRVDDRKLSFSGRVWRLATAMMKRD
jgi:hypothetical protein